jgi:hypothetical protein
MRCVSVPSEPPPGTAVPELLGAYLDYYRATVLDRLDGLTDAQLRRSRLPSGWSPLELLHHLAWVERRWFAWGLAAEPEPRPWGDRGPDDRWHVPADLSADGVRDLFRAACERSRALTAGVPLERRAAAGGRFPAAEDAPTLGWIMCHVLQEYARHAGHLDIVRELLDATAEP